MSIKQNNYSNIMRLPRSDIVVPSTTDSSSGVADHALFSFSSFWGWLQLQTGDAVGHVKSLSADVDAYNLDIGIMLNIELWVGTDTQTKIVRFFRIINTFWNMI